MKFKLYLNTFYHCFQCLVENSWWEDEDSHTHQYAFIGDEYACLQCNA